MSLKKSHVIALASAIALIAIFSLRSKRAAGTSDTPPAHGAQLLWKFKCDRGAVASITLGANGAIYAGANGGLYSLTLDGKLKWKTPLAGLLYVSRGSDDISYIASSYGLIFGVSSDGKMSWKPGMGLIGFGGPPAIGAEGLVLYANSVSDLYAFTPQRSDSPIWSQSAFREGIISENASLSGQATTQQNSRNSPVIWRDETIVLPRQHWLHYFNPDGSHVWFIELTSGELGPAALADDGTIYVADNQKNLYAVDRRGDLKWQYAADSMVLGSPAVGEDGLIYFDTPRFAYALTSNGTLKWQVPARDQWFSTSAALAADGTIYFGGEAGLIALHQDGSTKWNVRTMSATGAPTIAADGTIYYPCGYMWVCAFQDEGSPLAKSSWPKVFHDPANTNRILTAF